MEKSLINAIAKAKRNADKEKYGFTETILDAIYEYYLREDEAEILFNKIKEYCIKNSLFWQYDIESEKFEYLKRYI